MGSSANDDIEEQMSLLVILDTYDTLQRRLACLNMKGQFCEPLKRCIEAVKKHCEKIFKPRNAFRVIYNYGFNTSLGTLDQLRLELEINYCARNIKIEVAGKTYLDGMVVPPIIQNETARMKDIRIRTLEHQLEDKEAMASRDNSLKNSNLGLRINDSISSTTESVNLVIMCQANGAPYEANFYDQTWIRFFLERNIYVILWNYRGYGRSPGTPTLQNIISDGRAVIKFAHDKFSIKRLIIYGRSIGTHVCKALAGDADLLVLGRGFSSISMIPKFKYGKFAQRVFDLLNSNYQINCRSLVESDCKKIILYDPKNDNIVNYLSSLTFGISLELANLFFNKSNRLDIESSAKLSQSRWMRLTNMSIQQDFYEKQCKLLNYYKLLLNERDAQVLFYSLKRIIKVCLARAHLKAADPEDEGAARVATQEFDLERLASETEVEILDAQTLLNIHEGRLPEKQYKKLNDPSMDYSKQVRNQPERKSWFKIIDKVFTGLAFIEAAGLRLPELFVLPEDQQLNTFHVAYS